MINNSFFTIFFCQRIVINKNRTFCFSSFQHFSRTNLLAKIINVEKNCFSAKRKNQICLLYQPYTKHWIHRREIQLDEFETMVWFVTIRLVLHRNFLRSKKSMNFDQQTTTRKMYCLVRTKISKANETNYFNTNSTSTLPPRWYSCDFGATLTLLNSIDSPIVKFW